MTRPATGRARLDLVVGPNGAGKSTLVAHVIAPHRPNTAFVNADVIAASRWPDAAEERAYEAASLAARTRERLIVQGASFIAETVFSHPSKLELIDQAHSAGYWVELHVVLVPVQLAVARVQHRVAAGGHSVPEDKIRARCDRLWPLVASAIDRADVSHVWNNAAIDGPDEVALLARGFPDGPCRWPAWAPAVLTKRWSPPS